MTAGAEEASLASRIGARLRTAWLGRPVVVERRLASTMDRARELAAGGPHRGRVVVAAEQERGRGRAGRRFVSPPGGLYFTAELDPLEPPGNSWRLGLCAALAVREAVASLGGPELALSWPNDLYAADAKVAGVLVELAAASDGARRAFVGVGVNVATRAEELRVPGAGAAGVLEPLAAGDPVADVLAGTLAALERLDGRLRAPGGWADVLESVRRAALPFVGTRQAVATPSGGRTAGICRGIAEDGALLLERDDGRVVAVRLGERDA